MQVNSSVEIFTKNSRLFPAQNEVIESGTPESDWKELAARFSRSLRSQALLGVKLSERSRKFLGTFKASKVLQAVALSKPSIEKNREQLESLYSKFPGAPGLGSDLKGQGWVFIGFQGEDPCTDFRGGGQLALDHLLNFCKGPAFLECFQRSKNAETEFFFCVAGINVTVFLTRKIKEGFFAGFFSAGDSRELILQSSGKIFAVLFERLVRLWCEDARSSYIMNFQTVVVGLSERVLCKSEKL